jgi:uncharacterized protein (UPF0335 family)
MTQGPDSPLDLVQAFQKLTMSVMFYQSTNTADVKAVHTIIKVKTLDAYHRDQSKLHTFIS